MSDREKDVSIAKAMGLEVRKYVALGEWLPAIPADLEDDRFPVRDRIVTVDGSEPIPDYSSPESSWLILDYLRESDDEDFAGLFQACFENLLANDGEFRYSFWEILPYLTPERIRDAAYEAAKHLVKE